jgi:hypothetical protein
MGAQPAQRCNEWSGNAPREVLSGRRLAIDNRARFIGVAQLLSVTAVLETDGVRHAMQLAQCLGHSLAMGR